MELNQSENLLGIARVINGGIAGFTGVCATFPIDLCKTRLQNQSVQHGQRMYKGMFDCMKQVFRSEGFFGLYRGALPNLLLIVPEKTIKLTVNDVLRRQLSTNGNITLVYQLIAGAGAAVCQVTVTAPMEILKIYGQDAGRVKAISTIGGTKKNALRVVYERHGLPGFWKGLPATLARDVPFSMIYFPLFAQFNKFGLTDLDSTRSPFIVTLASGIAAAAISAVAVNPFDVVKTRLQSIHRATDNYAGMIDCFRRIYREEGFRSFYRGIGPRMLAIAPLFGIAQSVYYFGLAEDLLGIPQLRPI
uniref:Mitochondrial glutamate carrier 1 n=1 Tax=Phallusia mammillata TaxID=59560 RepID=A0A6F9DRV0_9ASCI|nr:mitochondrial glutamate carrier 1 [Phallusia mammillata]